MIDLRTTRFWAVTLPYLQAIRAGTLVASQETWAARGAARAQGDVTVVPIMGVLTQRGGWYGTSLERTRAALRDAAADGSGAIVLEVDSPGGEVYGVEELAAEVRDIRGQKPVVAVANSLAASAAYYIASQAEELFVTPSGEVGSIGVYGMHIDLSVALDQMGVKVTFISAGEGKVEGNPYAPLSEEAASDMQENIDRYYGMFVTSVKKGRGRELSVEKVRGEWGAWVYGAKQAVEIGMADHVGTLDDAVRRARTLARERNSKAAALGAESDRRIRHRARMI